MVKVGKLSCALLACIVGLGYAQDKPAKLDPLTAQQYIKPPQEIMEAVLAPWHLNVNVANLSPDRTRFIAIQSHGMPPLALLGKPYVNLGGLQVDLQANRARRFTTSTADGLKVEALADGKEVQIDVPKGLVVGDARWSPDGSRVAFFGHSADATHIFIADAATGEVRRLTKRACLATFTTTYEWVKDGTAIVTVLVPQNRPKEPEKPAVAAHPRVRVSDNKVSRIRTYPSLLDGPYDEAMLEYFTTGQLALVDAQTGKVQEIGKPAMIESVNPAPAGDYFLLTLMVKPFSYIVPTDTFGRRDVLWDAKGAEKAEIDKRPL